MTSETPRDAIVPPFRARGVVLGLTMSGRTAAARLTGAVAASGLPLGQCLDWLLDVLLDAPPWDPAVPPDCPGVDRVCLALSEGADEPLTRGEALGYLVEAARRRLMPAPAEEAVRLRVTDASSRFPTACLALGLTHAELLDWGLDAVEAKLKESPAFASLYVMARDRHLERGPRARTVATDTDVYDRLSVFVTGREQVDMDQALSAAQLVRCRSSEMRVSQALKDLGWVRTRIGSAWMYVPKKEDVGEEKDRA